MSAYTCMFPLTSMARYSKVLSLRAKLHDGHRRRLHLSSGYNNTRAYEDRISLFEYHSFMLMLAMQSNSTS